MRRRTHRRLRVVRGRERVDEHRRGVEAPVLAVAVVAGGARLAGRLPDVVLAGTGWAVDGHVTANDGRAAVDI